MGRIPTNLPLLNQILTAFIANEVRKVSMGRFVIGLSGDVDAALSACLAASALGLENVFAIRVLYKPSSKESLEHADLGIAAIGIQSALKSCHRSMHTSRSFLTPITCVVVTKWRANV